MTFDEHEERSWRLVLVAMWELAWWAFDWLWEFTTTALWFVFCVGLAALALIFWSFVATNVALWMGWIE